MKNFKMKHPWKFCTLKISQCMYINTVFYISIVQASNKTSYMHLATSVQAYWNIVWDKQFRRSCCFSRDWIQILHTHQTVIVGILFTDMHVATYIQVVNCYILIPCVKCQCHCALFQARRSATKNGWEQVWLSEQQRFVQWI